jgi:hypothetical protein
VTASADSYRLYELDRLDDIAAYRTVIAEIVGASGPIDRLIVFFGVASGSGRAIARRVRYSRQEAG